MGGAPSLAVGSQPVIFSLHPGLARIIAPQGADPEAEIDEYQRHSGKGDRKLSWSSLLLLAYNISKILYRTIFGGSLSPTPTAKILLSHAYRSAPVSNIGATRK